MVLQDVATGIDLVGVVLIEAPLVLDACALSSGIGCAAGVLIAWQAWAPLNALETIASWGSTAFTVVDDFIVTGSFGENTKTAVTLSLLGMMSPDPALDLIIDGYGSGYNHGVFTGISTIFSGGSVFQP